MGLAGTAANPIAATAAVFGLGTTFFDASVSTVVFQVGPATVRNIVVKSQDAYRDLVMSNIGLYHSRPDVIIGLQGYLQLCTPVAIESAVEAGASSISFDAKAGQKTSDPQPSLLQSSNTVPTREPAQVTIHTVVISSPKAQTTSTQKLMSWVFPKNKLNSENAGKLNAWMSSQHIDPSLNGKPWVELLSAGGEKGGSTPQQIELDRQQAINDIQIP
jgi:hypothetical protein